MRSILVILCMMVSALTWGENETVFRQLTTAEGLSNSQVNHIMRDSKGFLWLSTESGLDRYDGFRFRNFFYDNSDQASLPVNTVRWTGEDATGNIWVLTSRGYCIFDPLTETFDRDVSSTLQSVGIRGGLRALGFDSERNMWAATSAGGLYFYNWKNKSLVRYPQGGHGKRNLPKGRITSINFSGDFVFVAYSDGTIVKISSRLGRVVWVSTYVRSHFPGNHNDCRAVADKNGNCWVTFGGHTAILCKLHNRWHDSVNSFLRSHGYNVQDEIIQVTDLREDNHHRLWIATSSAGIIVLSSRNHSVMQYQHSRENEFSLSDNNLCCLYIDRSDNVWIGTSTRGLAFHSASDRPFKTMPLGDICTITQDRQGVYWMGTNGDGIITYNSLTGAVRRWDKDETGLRSDLVISSLTASDGSLWFGAYDGGLCRYSNGHFKSWHASRGALAGNVVTALAEDSQGNIVIATLGGGLQILNPKTEEFRTYNTANSLLPTNDLTSVSMSPDGLVVIGHSYNYSVFYPDSRAIRNFQSTRGGQLFPNSSITQILCDSRGIVWLATPSGLSAYDPKTDQMEKLRLTQRFSSEMVCALAEDTQHKVWVSTDEGVSCIAVDRAGSKWRFYTVGYNGLDGLPRPEFNMKSAYLDNKGNVIFGGQEGVSIIPSAARSGYANARVLFSGISMDGSAVGVGEKVNGSVVISQSVNTAGKLSLSYRQNDFTVLLASSEISFPQHINFLYRMKGLDNNWKTTSGGRPEIAFANLPPGMYSLEVRVVDSDGKASAEVSTLDIHVAAPVWFSTWAFILYFVIVLAVIFLYKLYSHRTKLKIRREEMMRQREKQMGQMEILRDDFLKNVSRELRTPLTLFISQLATLSKNELNTANGKKLKLIHSRALRLLYLVNRLLDFNKFMSEIQQVSLHEGDIVEVVRASADNFANMSIGHAKVNFSTQISSLGMVFDREQVDKMVSGMLEASYKLVGDNGTIDVNFSIEVRKDRKNVGWVVITVSSDGRRISPKDKPHLFDEFYNVDDNKGQHVGNTGLSLHMVSRYVMQHGGHAYVSDNDRGGTTLGVTFPIRRLEHTAGVPVSGNTTDNIDSNNRQTAQGMKSPTTRYKVLLVDDDEHERNRIRSLLATRYDVDDAINGVDALTIAKSRRPDIVLTDTDMPEMDGAELLKNIRKLQNMGSVPVIILSEEMSEEEQVRYFSLGANDYVGKQVPDRLLFAHVDNMLHLSSLRKHHHADDTTASQSDQQPQADSQFLQDVRKLVEAHLGQPEFNVEALAGEMGISRVLLYKKAIDFTGNPPTELIRNIRLQHAEQLLKDGNYSVSEVAYRVGFNNPRYFSKHFQDLYGETPSQFKKNAAKKI